MTDTPAGDDHPTTPEKFAATDFASLRERLARHRDGLKHPPSEPGECQGQPMTDRPFPDLASLPTRLRWHANDVALAKGTGSLSEEELASADPVHRAPHLELDGDRLVFLDQFEELTIRRVIPARPDTADETANNLARAGKGYRTLRVYAQESGLLFEDAFTVIGDLLTDLRHLTDTFGIDWEQICHRDLHYENEIRGGL